MNYDELKQTIEKYLVESDFEIINGIPTRVVQKANHVVINGEPHTEVHHLTLQLKCLGEGSMDDKPLVGYTLCVQDHDMIDLWLSELKDLTLFSIL